MWTAGVASAQACCVTCSETFKCKCAARPLSGGAGPSETDNAQPSSSPALCTANHPTSAWPAMPVRYTWLCPISAPGAGTGRMERQTRGKAPAGSKARRTAKRTKRTETPAGSRPLTRQRGLPVDRPSRGDRRSWYATHSAKLAVPVGLFALSVARRTAGADGSDWRQGRHRRHRPDWPCWCATCCSFAALLSDAVAVELAVQLTVRLCGLHGDCARAMPPSAARQHGGLSVVSRARRTWVV